jgi:hypothetical protein
MAGAAVELGWRVVTLDMDDAENLSDASARTATLD